MSSFRLLGDIFGEVRRLPVTRGNNDAYDRCQKFPTQS